MAAPQASRALVDPELLPALDTVDVVDLSARTLSAVRAADRDAAQRVCAEAARYPGVRVDSHYLPRTGAPGSEVRALVCRPVPTGAVLQPAVLLPAVLWIHGGGYVSGSADLDLPQALALADDLGCVVAVVDYRLAPECPFPAALDDCVTVLRWLAEGAGDACVDPARIAVAGESAGGGLAAATCLLARDRGDVRVAYQLLVYPMLDDRTVTRQGHPYAGELVWTPASNRFGWIAYLGGEPGRQEQRAYAVPSRSADLAGLPPTYLEVGSLDLFVDEDIEYARRLIQAGVPTELHVRAGAYHGFPPGTSVHAAHHREVRAALRRGLALRVREDDAEMEEVHR